MKKTRSWRFEFSIEKDVLLLIMVISVALLLRIWGLSYDLPYVYHPDEPGLITIIQNIFKTGDLNPRFFHYPSLFFYINAVSYIPYYLFGKFLGYFKNKTDILAPISLVMGTTWAPMPGVVLLGRWVTVMFGVGTVGLAYWLGKQLGGRSLVGVLAAGLLAVSPTNVMHSRYVTPDTLVTFWAVATLLAAVRVYQRGGLRHYLMAGVAIGLTASSKYNGALIASALLVAHFMRYGKAGFREPKLYLALFMSALTFLATTPFAILDFPRFIADLKFDAFHYSTGHAGMEGDSFRWYLNYMWKTAGIVYIISFVAIIYGILYRSKYIILISSFPVIYFGFISNFQVRNDRTFLPITPFLFVIFALFCDIMIEFTKNLKGDIERFILRLIMAGMLIGAVFQPVWKTIADTSRLLIVDSRETARVWIDQNLPPGSRIAIESYSPFIDPQKFYIQGFGSMIEHDPEWYVENNFNYLVFSEGMYGRFYLNPARYRDQILKYERFFRNFDMVMLFNDGDYEIRIYRIGSPKQGSQNEDKNR